MYTHLTKEERKAISQYLSCNWEPSRIASVLGKDKSTITRELARNSDKGKYQYGYADTQSRKRRLESKEKSQKIQNTTKLRTLIIKRLKKRDSPEQIAGRLRHKGIILCHETIYQWIYTNYKEGMKDLRRKRSKFRRKRGTNKRIYTRRIAQFKSIDERPEAVNNKERIGDFEGDTIIGSSKKSRILTHVERCSGYGIGDLLSIVTADIVNTATAKSFKKLSKKDKYTITYDRGLEFGGDDSIIEKGTGMAVYRAHAYHSWERGCNENWNGLIRDFYPKGTDFDILTQRDIDAVVRNLNHRPRKRLGYLTPHEVFVKKMVVKKWCSSR